MAQLQPIALTPREHDILEALRFETNANAIADRICMSRGACKNMLTVIYEKTGASNLLELYKMVVTQSDRFVRTCSKCHGLVDKDGNRI